MQVEESNNKPAVTVELNLTPDQMVYLNSIIPKGFMILSSTKTSRESKDSRKIKNLKRIVEEESKLDISQSQKSITDKPVPDIKRQRTSKSTLSIKQEKTITPVPRTAYVFEEAITAEMKPCLKIIQHLKKHPSAWPFLEPVDPVKLDIPTYFDIVKEPIDLSTIWNNLRAKHYATPIQFHADILKMFTNSYRFNHEGSQVHTLTKQLQQFYNRLVQEPDATVSHHQVISPQQRLETHKASLKRQSTAQYQAGKKRKPVEVIIPPLTLAEKKTLGQNIRKLPRDSLKGVWEIVCQGNISSEELKFDIDQLSVTKARELEIYVSRELSKNVGSEYVPKQINQTSETQYKGKLEDSEDASSFMLSEESN